MARKRRKTVTHTSDDQACRAEPSDNRSSIPNSNSCHLPSSESQKPNAMEENYCNEFGTCEGPKIEVFQATDDNTGHPRLRMNPEKLSSMGCKCSSSLLTALGGIGEIARKLDASLDKGLRLKDTTRRNDREKIYGVNKFNTKKDKSFWMLGWEMMQEMKFFTPILLLAVSAGVEIATEGWPNYTRNIMAFVLCIFLIIMVVSFIMYKCPSRFMDSYEEETERKVKVIGFGDERDDVYNTDLVVGDIVHLPKGEEVPADGISFGTRKNLLIDESRFSGKIEPVNICEENPFLLLGTKVQNRDAKMMVTAVGMRTKWGKLMKKHREAGEQKMPLQEMMKYCHATFMVCVVVFLVLKLLRTLAYFTSTEWPSSDMLNLLNCLSSKLNIILAASPIALPMAMRLSFGFGGELMNISTRVRLPWVYESMGYVSCICAGETRTLATKYMKVKKLWIREKTETIEEGNESGNSCLPSIGETVGHSLLQCIHNTILGVAEGQDDDDIRIESALKEFCSLLASNSGPKLQNSVRLKVKPFDSNRNMMCVLFACEGGGYRAFCKGKPEVILEKCSGIIDISGNSVCITDEHKKNVKSKGNEFKKDKLTALCFAFKGVSQKRKRKIPDDGYTLLAVVGIKDLDRSDTVKTCSDAGITGRVVTCDSIREAKNKARAFGILEDKGTAIKSQEFSNQNSERTSLIHGYQVRAECSPSDKRKEVEMLRSSGQTVAVVGNGAVDAIALRKADIGLAMGIKQNKVAEMNADIIITNADFKTIVNLLKRGRMFCQVFQKVVQLQITVIILAAVNIALECISGSNLLTGGQIMWVNLSNGILAALAMEAEPHNNKVMEGPPVRRDINVITRTMWLNVFGQSMYQLLILLVTSFGGKQLLRLDGSDALNCFAFNCIIFCQVFNHCFLGMLKSHLVLVAMVCLTMLPMVIVVGFQDNSMRSGLLTWQPWFLGIFFGFGSKVVANVVKLTGSKGACTTN